MLDRCPWQDCDEEIVELKLIETGKWEAYCEGPDRHILVISGLDENGNVRKQE